jgi:iron complex transport system substrate-binding protein
VPLHRYRPDVVARRAAWAEVPAIRTGAIACVTEAFLGRPGPRLVDGYDALAALIDARRSTP